MRIWLPGLLALLLGMGCAAFEQNQNALPDKLSGADRGHLYIPEPVP